MFNATTNTNYWDRRPRLYYDNNENCYMYVTRKLIIHLTIILLKDLQFNLQPKV